MFQSKAKFKFQIEETKLRLFLYVYRNIFQLSFFVLFCFYNIFQNLIQMVEAAVAAQLGCLVTDNQTLGPF